MVGEQFNNQSIQDRLRAAIMKLRTTSLPLCDMIPLMQEAADELDTLINEKEGYQEEESDMLLVAYMHGAEKAKSHIAALQKELKNARTLICDAYNASTPGGSVRGFIETRTGNWFAFGVDRTDYKE